MRLIGPQYAGLIERQMQGSMVAAKARQVAQIAGIVLKDVPVNLSPA
jgi:hypothetical protein